MRHSEWLKLSRNSWLADMWVGCIFIFNASEIYIKILFIYYIKDAKQDLHGVEQHALVKLDGLNTGMVVIKDLIRQENMPTLKVIVPARMPK